MRIEFEMDRNELLEANRYVCLHGRESHLLLRRIRKTNFWWSIVCLGLSAAIVLGWGIYLDRTGPTQFELVERPMPGWVRWGLGLSAILALFLFFTAAQCFRLWRNPGNAIDDHADHVANQEGWEGETGRFAIELNERGVSWESQEITTTHKTSKVAGIDRSDRFFYLYVEPDFLYPAPIRLNDTAKVDELIEQIADCSGADVRVIPASNSPTPRQDPRSRRRPGRS